MPSGINAEQVKQNLIKLGSELSPSEFHGTLCGVLCVKSDINFYEWLSLSLLDSDKGLDQQLTKAVKSRDLLLEAISEPFKDFFKLTIRSLADSNLAFQPLLSIAEDKTERLQSIAQWSQGFLMGLSIAGIKDLSTYPPEVSEFIEALGSLSNVTDYALADNESDEDAIIEFIEFIRMGVLFVNEEMNPIRVPVEIPESFLKTEINK